MKNTALEILIKQINSNLKILNDYGFNIFDKENEEWFLNLIEYNAIEDKIYFKCEEAK